MVTTGTKKMQLGDVSFIGDDPTQNLPAFGSKRVFKVDGVKYDSWELTVGRRHVLRESWEGDFTTHYALTLDEDLFEDETKIKPYDIETVEDRTKYDLELRDAVHGEVARLVTLRMINDEQDRFFYFLLEQTPNEAEIRRVINDKIGWGADYSSTPALPTDGLPLGYLFLHYRAGPPARVVGQWYAMLGGDDYIGSSINEYHEADDIFDRGLSTGETPDFSYKDIDVPIEDHLADDFEYFQQTHRGAREMALADTVPTLRDLAARSMPADPGQGTLRFGPPRTSRDIARSVQQIRTEPPERVPTLRDLAQRQLPFHADERPLQGVDLPTPVERHLRRRVRDDHRTIFDDEDAMRQAFVQDHLERGNDRKQKRLRTAAKMLASLSFSERQSLLS